MLALWQKMQVDTQDKFLLSVLSNWFKSIYAVILFAPRPHLALVGCPKIFCFGATYQPVWCLACGVYGLVVIIACNFQPERGSNPYPDAPIFVLPVLKGSNAFHSKYSQYAV